MLVVGEGEGAGFGGYFCDAAGGVQGECALVAERVRYLGEEASVVIGEGGGARVFAGPERGGGDATASVVFVVQGCEAGAIEIRDEAVLIELVTGDATLR